MSKDIEIKTTMKGNTAVLYIKGDITAISGEPLVAEYKSNNVTDAEKVVLDFDKNCYINSGGLAYLIDIASDGRKRGRRICVTGLSDHFQKIFKMVGLTRCVDIFPTTEEALR